MSDFLQTYERWNRALLAHMSAAGYFMEGSVVYHEEFMQPLLSATQIFHQVESARIHTRSPQEIAESYIKLCSFNNELLMRYSQGSLSIYNHLFHDSLDKFINAWTATLLGQKGEQIDDFCINQKETLIRVMREYPEAIKAIEPEYGFHFEDKPESHFAETDRFILREVFPTKKGVMTDPTLKPVIIIPPFVLGANILAFLPNEEKSYAHSFANRSIPTYIRTMKDIQTTEAVQKLTLEDDLKDTVFFCREVKKKHGLPVTLNGYCQGGFSALCNILTGKLDGLVDALITCVAPIDGTRSVGLGHFLKRLPEQFNDLRYGTKTLNNGNQIADGSLMGWVYKLKSIEDSGPMANFFKDIIMLGKRNGASLKINKTIAALNYWLQNERSDLPLSVTEMSFNSYNTPISDDGTLPLTIGGKKLNIKAIRDNNIKWLLCYGQTDDLVEKEVALAPLDWVDVEVTPFPKGHVAIATSWSRPGSACSLDSVFGDGNYRGPVRFHLDLAKKFS